MGMWFHSDGDMPCVLRQDIIGAACLNQTHAGCQSSGIAHASGFEAKLWGLKDADVVSQPPTIWSFESLIVCFSDTIIIILTDFAI
jgi:hypothetical protein